MRILAVGDIHGCSTALDTLLTVVALEPDDRLITLGDYVDRGPDSRGVLDRLIALYEAGRLTPLRGNHDQMMAQARRGFDLDMWLACGGDATLASYGEELDPLEDLQAVPERHWRFLAESCRDWYETEHHFFVHANAYPDLPLEDQPEYMLLWEKLWEPVAHVSGKIMVCGHTPQRGGRPVDFGTTVCIDTGIYRSDGWLTCLDVRSGLYWQANQRGEHRVGWLEEERD